MIFWNYRKCFPEFSASSGSVTKMLFRNDSDFLLQYLEFMVCTLVFCSCDWFKSFCFSGLTIISLLRNEFVAALEALKSKIKLFILLNTKLCIFTFSVQEIESLINVLERIGPKIDTCITANCSSWKQF